jgi:ABC-type transport system involved in multi-copper enzyme maturation permease subunit
MESSREHTEAILWKDHDVRLRPGPVFVYEWLTTTRRWQLYGMRAAFVGTILIGMIVVWQNSRRFSRPGAPIAIQALAEYGENLYKTVVVVELTLVLLAAPAATAGAVCLDKARGTLDHILATDLSNSEIVLGKLGVRIVPVFGLIACTLPIMALASLLGGIDPEALVGSFLTAIGCASLGCSLALALSVWGRKTHEVLMMTFLILIVWLISPLVLLTAATGLRSSAPQIAALSIWDWIKCSNPYYLAFAPYAEPGKVGWAIYGGFLGVCVGLSAMLLALATLQIRAVALKHGSEPAASTARRWLAFRLPTLAWLPAFPGPSLDGNPVLWREWHRSRPSRFLRLVWLLYAALGLLWCALAIQVVNGGQRNEELGVMTMSQVAIGLLLISVSAVTSLAEERARGSLDLLLTTPLSTRSILIGKWWGSFRLAAHVVVWPVILAGLLVIESGNWISYLSLLGLILAYCSVITSLGLALATWVSRLGRAVTLCVSAYVLFSIGWVILVVLLALPMRASEHFIVPLIEGSPLYGTLFSTFAVAPGPHLMPGGGADVWVGTVLWTMIHACAAALLFAATVATFDRCLGRVSEMPGHAIPHVRKKPVGAADLDLDAWFAGTPTVD